MTRRLRGLCVSMVVASAVAAGIIDASPSARAQTAPASPSVSSTPEQACAAFRQAGEAGDAAAAHAYASCAYTGTGMAQDFDTALAWYGEAVQLGSVKAQCALGNMLIRGQATPADPRQGIALCRSAAEAGDRDALADLGGYYLAGIGVDRDVVAAEHWLKQAADLGHTGAAFTMGRLMWDGVVDGGKAASAHYWRQAVLAGRTDAARWLGEALMITAVAGADAADGVDWPALEAARAAFVLARDDDPDPDVRVYAQGKLDTINALFDAVGR